MDRHSRTIRLSFGAQKALRQVAATVRQLEAREGRAPSDEEIARELDWNEERVAWLRSLPQEAIPFEASTSASDDNEGLPLIDVLPSDDPPIDEAVTDALLCDRALSVLCERERDLLLRRYGLAPYEDRQTCREIARAVCCSPQRVALIERRALRRIRTALGVPATDTDR
jgi:RNA polymerase primary sigma factor